MIPVPVNSLSVVLLGMLETLKEAMTIPNYEEEAKTLHYTLTSIIQLIILDDKEAKSLGKTIFTNDALCVKEMEEFFQKYADFTIRLKNSIEDEIRRGLRGLGL